MSKNFAVLDGINIINTIVADSKKIAEEVTGKTCIEFTTEHAETGGTYIDGIFIPKKPYPSWTLVNGSWNSPVEQTASKWDEATQSWVD